MVPVAKSRSPIAGFVTVPTTPSPTPERQNDKNITIFFPTKTISYKNLISSKIVKKITHTKLILFFNTIK